LTNCKKRSKDKNIEIQMSQESTTTPEPIKEVTKKKKSFKIAAAKLSLTYPQCPAPKDLVFEGLKNNKYPKIIVVSQEEHKDGNKHLHVYLEYPTRFRSSKPTVFDIVYNGVTYHPNIQSTKKKAKWLNYLTKEDPEPLVYGIDLDAYLQAVTKKKSYALYQCILKKKKITQEMINENPTMLRGLCNLQRDLAAYNQLPTQEELEREPLTEVTIWNHKEIVMPRKFKQRQYWICGSKNKGKTTMIMNLIEKGYSGYEMPVNNDWSGYHDGVDFMWIDEYRGALTIQMLNRLLDGQPCRLNTKGGVVFKNKNIPIFIISNYLPEEVYNKIEDDKLDTLLCRIKIIKNFNHDGVIVDDQPDVSSESNITYGEEYKCTNPEILELKKDCITPQPYPNPLFSPKYDILAKQLLIERLKTRLTQLTSK